MKLTSGLLLALVGACLASPEYSLDASCGAYSDLEHAQKGPACQLTLS